MQSQPIPSLKAFKQEALELLMQLIATPSFSGEEEQAAAILEQFFHHHDIPVHRAGNNVWVRSEPFEPERPTLLLNSHIDTVQPGAGWSRSPFEPVLEEGKLYGLGSNDAKAAVTHLLKGDFGWKHVHDMGGLENARGMEAWLLFWTRLYRMTGTGLFNIRLVKEG